MGPCRLGACAALVAALVCGCGPDDRACTLRGVVSQVAVDVGALGPPTATASARLCVESDCTTTTVDRRADRPAVAAWRRPVPHQPTVTVTLELTDPATGTVVYRGSGRVAPHQVEPNGPGCGSETVLPVLTASPDGSIRG